MTHVVISRYPYSSEHDLSLLVLLLSEDESLGSLEDSVRLALGLGALELEGDLLGLLGLLFEDWLGLTTETLLLHVVSSLTLSGEGGLTGLVLGHLVDGVLLELPAISSDSLWNMHHFVISSCLTN